MSDRVRLNGDRDVLAKLGNFQAIRATTANTVALNEDKGAIVKITAGSGVTFTINTEANTTGGWTAGDTIRVMQGGAGAVTITAGSGVTLTKISTKTLATTAANAMAEVIYLGSDTWLVRGDT